MNYLVFVDTRTAELEKILSGVKTMAVKEFDPAQPMMHPVIPGDSLYFLRDQEEFDLRVRATVVRVLTFTNHSDEGLSHIFKEMQPKLQLTEDQYYYWSEKQQVLLVEFGAAHKIPVIQVAAGVIKDRSVWVAFETFNHIMA